MIFIYNKLMTLNVKVGSACRFDSEKIGEILMSLKTTLDNI